MKTITIFLSRHSGAVVATGAVLTGAALWIILVARLGFGHAEAGLLTGLTLLSLAQLHIYRDRMNAGKAMQAELERLMATSHDLMGDFSALRDDVKEMRKGLGDKEFLHADRISTQIAALEAVIERVDEAQDERAAAEERLVREFEALAESTASGPPPGQGGSPAAANDPAGPRAGAQAPRRHAADLMARISGAVAASRVDLYLQPIVTLPQRKVRFYEALTRLRDEEGHIIMPRDYLPTAREAGLTSEIDNILLIRSIALVRRLMARKRDAGVFCNIAETTLTDGGFFPQFIEFMEANAELAPALVFEFSEETLDQIGPLDEESLHALKALGFHFSLDHVRALDLDFDRLAGLGFRFVKVDAAVMLNAAAAEEARVHPEDLARLAQRYGIELIVEKIEAENMVVNILDYDVRLAQGYLFARPRLVREEGTPAPFRAAA